MKTAAASALPDLVGTVIGVSDWITVDQDRINQFADVTEDHQFIHINEDMAKMTPFGGTIAHGFLTLSLLSKFSESAGLVIEGVKMGVNYGFNNVRFLAPVPSGSKVRAQFTLKEAVEKKPGQHLLTYEVTVEIDGQDKPALICDWLGMQFTG
ncbi:MaoC family dehydratase [Hellea balneolensis]|uniref:MaoC family dehydratase n=1 Tax=Hellea balneolensis TaxID=287478 RepID=UPI0003F8A680|nr:MaoC family dehydratase [Hellea balneolensis]